MSSKYNLHYIVPMQKLQRTNQGMVLIWMLKKSDDVSRQLEIPQKCLVYQFRLFAARIYLEFWWLSWYGHSVDILKYTLYDLLHKHCREYLVYICTSDFSSFSRAVVVPSSTRRLRPVLATRPSCHTRNCAVCDAPITSPKCARAFSGGNSRGCVFRDHRLSNVT